MKEGFVTIDVAEFSQGCTFTAEDLQTAMEQFSVSLNVSKEEVNRRIREGLASYWLRHIYDCYAIRKGVENASKSHYVNTYIKSGFSMATYKSYESLSRVNEAISKDNLRRIISAFCRFSNEFQQRKHSPLDCLLLIAEGRTRARMQSVNHSISVSERSESTHKYLVAGAVVFLLVLLALVYKVAKLETTQNGVQSNTVQQKQLIEQIRDIGSVEYANHATDQVAPEKLQIKYPTKHPVYKYDLSGVEFKTPVGGHASFKEESIRINWVLVQCETDCTKEFAQRGGPTQVFGSTQTHAVVAPPKNNWHVPDLTLFAGRNLFIATATYSTGIKRVESLILEPKNMDSRP